MEDSWPEDIVKSELTLPAPSLPPPGSLPPEEQHGTRTNRLTCMCICKLFPDYEFECDHKHLFEGVSSDSRKSARCSSHEIVMRCPSVHSGIGGTFVMRPQQAHLSAFVRVSGPVVDTIFFQKTWWEQSDCQVWTAPYMECGSGSYVARVHTLLLDADPWSVWQGRSCLLRNYSEDALLFSWRSGLNSHLENPHCHNLYHWPNFSLSSVTTKLEQQVWIQLMFSQMFSQLRRTNLATNKDERQRFEATLDHLVEPFSEQYQEETLPMLRNLSSVVTSISAPPHVCFLGDSHTRNLVNSMIQVLMSGFCRENEMCDPIKAQRTKSVIQVPVGGAEEGHQHPEDVAIAITQALRDSETCSRLTISFSGLVQGCVYRCQARLWSQEIGSEWVYTDPEITLDGERWGVAVMDLDVSLASTSRLWGIVKMWDVNVLSGIDIDDALLASKSVTLHPCKPSMSPSERILATSRREKLLIWRRKNLHREQDQILGGDTIARQLKYFRFGFPNHWCSSGHSNATVQNGGVVSPSFALHAPCPSDHPGPFGIQKCRQVFVNVGTWPLASGWNLSEYRMGLEQLMLQLGSFSVRREHRVPIVFLSTPPSPINDNMLKCPNFSPGDSRLPHHIMLYNLVAQEMVRNMDGVEFLDTTLSMMPLFDLAFDGTHYQV